MTKRLIFLAVILAGGVGAQTYTWQQQGTKLPGSGTGTYWQAGQATALSNDGNTLLVGQPMDNSSVGSVLVWVRTGTTWGYQTQLSVGASVIAFGSSVALSGDGNTALIGAPSYGSNYGAAYVFTRTGTTWSQQQQLTFTEHQGSSPSYGTSVALSSDGTTAAVGAPFEGSPTTGAVWVFTRGGSTWTQQQKIVGTGSLGGSPREGSSVAVSSDGSTIAFGGYSDDSTNTGAGAVWVWYGGGGSWSQQTKIVGQGTAFLGPAGALAISGDGNTLIAGGPSWTSTLNTQGGAWVWSRSGSTWTSQGGSSQYGGVLSSAPQVGGAEGYSVSISADGNTAAISMTNNNTAGGFFVWTRSGSTWTKFTPSELTGTGATGQAAQGRSIAISGNGTTIAIGGSNDNTIHGAEWVFIRALIPTNTRRVILVN